MDFYRIKEKTNSKSGLVEIYPDFRVCRSKDLMIRGGKFYAIWDEEKGLWSTDEYDVQRLVDKDLSEYTEDVRNRRSAVIYTRYMSDFSTKSWAEFRNYINHISDNATQLDERITFKNDKITKNDYVSRRLEYDLKEGPCDAYHELMSALYDQNERDKLEWAIGAIISGDAKTIQKFIVLYGEGGTGKSTVLNIIQKLFNGYYSMFDAKILASSNNAFATEVFRTNPLVAIQHDGDLSRIEDNTKLNSIVSHEEMTMNEKFKSAYTAKTNCFLFMGTNKPVKITDGKSGIIRRLIDVHPTGNKIPFNRYEQLMSQINYELGSIAFYCLQKYKKMGPSYYNGYKPLGMMFQTDVFFNFVENYYDDFAKSDGVTLRRAYELYKMYCDEALVDFKLPMYKFREELKNYFYEFIDRTYVDGKDVRSYYKGFIVDKFKAKIKDNDTGNQNLLGWLALTDNTPSIFDEIFVSAPAQYASEKETPVSKWDTTTTTLSDIDTKKLHYVRVPQNLIVIDFDLKDEEGNKSLDLNLREALNWPKTYAEVSKGQNGLHLHYWYDGNPEELAIEYKKGVEIKVFSGLSSLRRKLTKCNTESISHISSGLPRKEKKMVDSSSVKSEKALRDLISRNLRKEIHPATKPSIDFIYKILEDAHASGLFYDVTDMRPKILAFANNSTNNSKYCLNLVMKMPFKQDAECKETNTDKTEENKPLVFFDVETFPNLFLICWKHDGVDAMHEMFNPTPEDIEPLLSELLVGFNNRSYDNHMIYAAYLGYTNQQLFELSQQIISNKKRGFGPAYNLSYTDVYDFASAGNKKSLKKWEIELGIHHQELGFKWDQPVPKEKWKIVAEYCGNDVRATEAVFHHLSDDWLARQILAELSGLTVNDTTNSHSTKIIFGNNKHPQDEFVYTDLSEMFPGYKYERGVSTYRGEEVGEGGYVYAEPGIYANVALLDIASMHPSSIEALCLFGPRYTKRFSEIKQSRICIKHNDLDKLSTLLDGALINFINRPDINPKKLSNALKTVINSVYGLTHTKFDNPFMDPRNVDNIVAKRGALFMVDLKHAVQEKGYTVAHIKTDSIKIPNATPEIIQFVMDYGKKYGYTFEHEATYERICLVNNAVYIARYADTGEWTATGAQFAHPYVFKDLFTKEEITFEDLCETKQVQTAIYLDLNESLPEGEHNYCFIGKVGSFCPVKVGSGGGILLREKVNKDGSIGYDSVNNSSGYRWLEAETISINENFDDIDRTYFEHLSQDAMDNISRFGSFDDFVNVDRPISKLRCGRQDGCIKCPNFEVTEHDACCKLGYDWDSSLPF